MENTTEYNTRTDFLPKGHGIIYVDTSGLEWVCPMFHRNIEGEKASLKKFKSFCKIFRERGYISTNEGVLKEVQKNKEHWSKKKKDIRKFRSHMRSGGRRKERCRDSTRERYNYFTEWLKASNKMCEILREGIDTHSQKNGLFDYTNIEKFIDGHRRLSGVDKGLVCTALNSSHGNGILSADMALIGAYYDGVKEFNLEKCFVCNSKESKTSYL